MITFNKLLEHLGGCNCPEARAPVSNKEADQLVLAWRGACQKFFGCNFNFSTHFIRDSLNHSRNSRQISTCELTFVMNKFFKKLASQFKRDAQDVKDGVAIPRGKNKHKLNENELEFVISSRSTDINVVFVLKRDFKKAGTAVMMPITIMRKRGWIVTKGEHIIVEDKEYSVENHYEVD